MEKKIFEITVNGSVMDWDDEEIFAELIGTHSIGTLEEYINLLAKISEFTDGQFTVRCCGLVIEMGWE